MKSKKFRVLVASALLLVGTAFGAKAMFATVRCYYTLNGACQTTPLTCQTTGITACVTTAGTIVYYQESNCQHQTTIQALFQ